MDFHLLKFLTYGQELNSMTLTFFMATISLFVLSRAEYTDPKVPSPSKVSFSYSEMHLQLANSCSLMLFLGNG